jgi:hypothetical protein
VVAILGVIARTLIIIKEIIITIIAQIIHIKKTTQIGQVILDRVENIIVNGLNRVRDHIIEN